ncbi:PAS domain S-box protein [Mesoterricola silvestris]|uniref:PAS domain S-box protein n=1 Tax=Mesoterricola silvestris TaxID=2927979 RepID=UPI00292F06A6|nr:PAS domain S-box protein [Mesoterricola silvestris]
MLTFCLGVALVGLGSYVIQKGLVRRSALNQLSMVADLKVEEIGAWMEARKASALEDSMGTAMALDVDRRLRTGRWSEGGQEQWLTRIRALEGLHGYRDVSLLGPDGALLLSSRGLPSGPDALEREALEAARRATAPFFTSIHLDADFPERPLTLDLVSPLVAMDKGGSRVVGFMAYRLDPGVFLFPLLRKWPMVTESAETILAERQGGDAVFLSELRHTREPALARRVPLTSRTVLAVQALSKNPGLLEGVDYRGIPVLGAGRPVPGTPWVLVAKQDKAELFRPLLARTLGLTLAASAVLLAIFLQIRALLQRRNRLMQANSEAQYQALFDSMADSVFLIGPDNRFLNANRVAVERLGYSLEELRGLGPADINPPEAAPAVGEVLATLAREGQSTFETVHLGKDGTPMPVEVRSRRVVIGGQTVIVSSARDISDRLAQEAEILRMNQLYAALSQVNQAIVWCPTREALLKKICEVMVDFGKFRLAWIGWDDPSTHEVAVVASHGDDQGYLDGMRVRSDDSPLGRGSVGTAIRTGRPSIFRDIPGAPAFQPWRDRAERSGIVSSASLPISQGGAVVGALTVYAAVADVFGPHELALLEEAAGDISFALDHLELDARRKKAEEELRASEARLVRAEGVAAFGNWDLDLETNIASVSQGACRIYGLAHSRFVMPEVQAQVLPAYRPILDAALRDLVEAGTPYDVEFEITRADNGQLRTIHSVAEYDPARRTVFGVIKDMTERKQMEDVLKEREYFFRESQRAAGIGSYRADFVGDSWTSSAVLDAIFGIGPDFARTIPGWMELIHPEDREGMSRYLAEHVIGGRRPFDREYRIVRRSDGAVRWVRGCGEGVLDAQGTCVGLMGTIQDITDSRLAAQENALLQAQLVQAQKMESLGVLAGGVAHDMNNVLGAVLALSSAHLTLHPEDSATFKAFDTIRKAATRGGKMVQSLLHFARKNPTERRSIDFNALILEEARLLERTTLAKVRLELNLAPDLRRILGDPGSLAGAVMNLCVNAVDALGDNGVLILHTRNLGGDRVEVRIEDNGCGMPAEVLEKAMDPFFTTKGDGKGTGLGLSLVYATVKAHGGTVEIQSEPGQGTRVLLRFPAEAAPPVEPQPEPAPGPEALPAPFKVLVVDDDDLVLSSTQMVVEFLGHTPFTAAGGEEALDRVRQGLRPDLVILDMNMPGLGGAETLKELRPLLPTVPVLLATGRVDQGALDLVAAHPHVHLLPKPFSMQDLQKMLRNLPIPSLGGTASKG